MKTRSRVCSKATARRPMSVSCCATRIPYWNASFLKRVGWPRSTFQPHRTDRKVGIDVQAELKSKTDTTHMPPSNLPHSVPQPSPQQRAVMNRHNQARRPASGSGLKILNPPSSQVTSIPNKPPQLQPNAPLQIQSPLTAKSPVSLVQGGMASPGGDRQAQQQPQPQRKPRSQSSRGQLGLAIPTSAPNMQAMSPNARGGGRSNEPHSASGNPAGYYPSLFQTHIEQLGKLSRPLLSLLPYRAMFVLD